MTTIADFTRRVPLDGRLSLLGAAPVAVAVGGSGEHVDRARAGPVGLATAGALGDLGPLVLGDHGLEPDQQNVLGAVGARGLR
ncbi:hypothetical protein [Streptomyces albicerus]|uniref:hypothetical protein n=1 Tax=Streptomyces albicerus TaxID=2569859 RepID=UPI0021F1A1CF|nr:hypothetical protein [Streptomyces albicerus]